MLGKRDHRKGILIMTVQELIDALSEIEDKTLPVVIPTDDHYYNPDVTDVEIISEGVRLNSF